MIRCIANRHQVAEARAKGNEIDKQLGQKLSQADAKLGQLKTDGANKFDEVRKETEKGIDQFDKTVERKTSEAKSGISSWFGGK